MLILVMSSYYMGLTDKIFEKVTFSEGQKEAAFCFCNDDELKSGFVRELGSRLQSKNASLALWVSGTEGEEKRRCEGKFSLISSAFHSSIVERSWDAMSRTIEKMGRGVDNE